MKKKVVQKSKSPTAAQYVKILHEIKQQIDHSQATAFAALNTFINKRNWIIGKIIVEKQSEHDWGSNFIEIIAKDLQKIYPENGGLSITNIYRMKAFYQAYQNIVAAATILENLPIFNIPWFHNVTLLYKVKNTEEALWYAQQAVQEGWSRHALENCIKSDLYRRQGKAITNFHHVLPDPDSAMIQQSFKDPYIFDYVALDKEYRERDLEDGLVENVQKLLLEMGKGFSFVERQYHIVVDDTDYYIDLLFYHIKLKRYVVVELKARAFEYKDAGQINFYLAAIDNQLRDENDNPTIGLVLCKTKKKITAEYALSDMKKPIGVASYETEIMNKLPKNLKSSLPTIAEIEKEFEKQELLQAMEQKSTIKGSLKSNKKHVLKKTKTSKIKQPKVTKKRIQKNKTKKRKTS